MRTEKYELEIKRTRSNDSDDKFWALGLTEEAGEVAGLIKKLHYHGGSDKNGPITANRILNECGDVLWYLTTLINQYGFTLEDCMELNMEKLRKRHPNGFTFKTAHAHMDESVCSQGACEQDAKHDSYCEIWKGKPEM